VSESATVTEGASIMGGPPPATIELSTRQRALLEQLRHRQTAPQRLVRRVLILLSLADNPCLQTTARDLGLNRISVRLWRDRWLDAAEALAQAERDNPSDQQLLGLIEEILDDAPRPGGPATFTPEQIVRIVAVACEPPEKSGRPISHWTHRELADEVKRRQIVKDIAPRSVGRFLKTGRAAAPSQPLLAQCQPARPGGLPRPSRGGLRPV
jgi:homeodomain-containing protein